MKPTYVKPRPSILLKERVKAIKESLPKNYKELIAKECPELDTIKGYQLITNVVRLRSSDELVTQVLEKIAASHMPVDVAKSDQEQTELQA